MTAQFSPRERVAAALAFRSPDVLPLRVYPAPGGLYEHGQKLVDLIKACGHDFGDLRQLALPEPPPPEDFDTDGRYHAFRTDEWGTRWEYRIFGIWGHPIEWPLNDLSRLDGYRAPSPPDSDGPWIAQARAEASTNKQTYYLLGSGDMLFERLRALRRFEEVLMDLASDTPEIHLIADRVVEHMAGCVKAALALDVDAICFGDDFGTQSALMISPQIFRRFFRPRYEALFEPILRARKSIFFHSCGRITPILGDLREMGVNTIWPQLQAYDCRELARICRDLQLCVELHPDRGDLMQRGTPTEVHDTLLRMVDLFDAASGGAWLYLEVDPGFPYTNVEAAFQTAMALRRR